MSPPVIYYSQVLRIQGFKQGINYVNCQPFFNEYDICHSQMEETLFVSVIKSMSFFCLSLHFPLISILKDSFNFRNANRGWFAF